MTSSKMTTNAEAIMPNRTLYLSAFIVFLVVLTGYVWTLAPTVTLWDAGEFIATARILGIPHPPGTPLFTLLANVWATVVPIGDFAYRTNLMSATFSAAAAAFFFLTVALALQGWRAETTIKDRVFMIGGGVAGALLAAFAFTVWQNSNETEVYVVATFSIAVTTWLAWGWRQSRGQPRAPHLMLIVVYLAAVSMGNHLLALLVGPPLIAFVYHVLRTEPLERKEDRKIEWAQWAVLTGGWALLIGTGLGSTTLLVLGGLAFLAAAIFASSVGGVRFAIAVLGIAVLGASTYLFLYFRANVGPFINEADPSTWTSLWDVIQRKQYPPRSLFDNPIFLSGRDNPGRSLTIMLLQVQNYLQYFDWQWSNGLAATTPVFAPIRLPFTLFFAMLGIYGATVLRQRDRSMFWLIVLLFVTTGPALMGYMNFRPGYSLGWDRFPNFDMNEVRERDYFFTVSFQAWGLLCGIGLAGLYYRVRSYFAGKGNLAYAPAVIFGVALLPFVLNFNAASRRHGPEAHFARDFAYDLLQSAEPYGIIFTNGDNDTFPLWYLQEVEEIRQDVSVVNLSLGNTDWYIRQLRDNPVRPFRVDQAPWFADFAPETSPPPLHSWTDDEVAGLRADRLASDRVFRAGLIDQRYPRGTPLYVKDILIFQLIRENWDKRPIYFSLTAGSGNWLQLEKYLTQQALVLRLNVESPPDIDRLAPGVLSGVLVDVPRSDSLAWHHYRYAGLLDADTLALDPWNRNIATNLSYVMYSLGQAYLARGDAERSMANFRRGYHLSPIAQIGALLNSDSGPSVVFGDTALRETLDSLPAAASGTPQ